MKIRNNLIYGLIAFISLFSFLTVSCMEVESERNTPYLFRGESLLRGESLFLYNDSDEWDKVELTFEQTAVLYLHQNGEKIKVWDSEAEDDLKFASMLQMTPSGKFVISDPKWDAKYLDIAGRELFFWEAIYKNVPGSYLAIEKTEDSARIAIYSPTHQLLWSSDTGRYWCFLRHI